VGAIYAKEVQTALNDGRIANVPYNPLLKVHAIWDLGWNDSMFIILAQRIRSEIAIIETIEDDHGRLLTGMSVSFRTSVITGDMTSCRMMAIMPTSRLG